MNDPNKSFLTGFHRLLTAYFDLEELRTLCFDLSIAYDDLRGEGKDNKARELIMLMARQKRLPELVILAQKRRPNANWSSAPKDSVLEAIPGSQETEITSTPVGTGSTFNISGDMNAGQVNVGGVQTFTGPINVDMRETTVNQPQKEVVMVDRTLFSLILCQSQ